MRNSVILVTNLKGPLSHIITAERETLRTGKAGTTRENVMVRTLAISVTAAVLFAGVWTANLLCYHPTDDGLSPLAPISMATWKE